MVENSAKLLTPEQVSEMLGVPVRTLYSWRFNKKGPKSLKVGRYLRYREDDVRRWLDELGSEAAAHYTRLTALRAPKNSMAKTGRSKRSK
jgi:excisionase family DNA binding protein